MKLLKSNFDEESGKLYQSLKALLGSFTSTEQRQYVLEGMTTAYQSILENYELEPFNEDADTYALGGESKNEPFLLFLASFMNEEHVSFNEDFQRAIVHTNEVLETLIEGSDVASYFKDDVSASVVFVLSRVVGIVQKLTSVDALQYVKIVDGDSPDEIQEKRDALRLFYTDGSIFEKVKNIVEIDGDEVLFHKQQDIRRSYKDNFEARNKTAKAVLSADLNTPDQIQAFNDLIGFVRNKEFRPMIKKAEAPPAVKKARPRAEPGFVG